MAWRVANSLNVLLNQLNALAPRRSKASDGSIGDTSHSSRSSDHNPWYGPGIVTARDFTHDPGGGLDCHKLAAWLIASRDRRIKYIIWNHRILSGNGGPSPWVWRAYDGPSAHTKHLHLSVVANPSCDDTRTWNLGASQPATVPTQEDPNVKNLVLANKLGADGKPTGEIWVGDGITRRHVADSNELDGLRFWIQAKGGDNAVHNFGDLRVLGKVDPATVPVQIDYDRFVKDVVAQLSAALGTLRFDAE